MSNLLDAIYDHMHKSKKRAKKRAKKNRALGKMAGRGLTGLGYSKSQVRSISKTWKTRRKITSGLMAGSTYHGVFAGKHVYESPKGTFHALSSKQHHVKKRRSFDKAIPVYVEKGRLESPRSSTFGLGPSPRSQRPTKDGYCWRVSYASRSGSTSLVIMQAWTPGDVKKKFESRLPGHKILGLEQIDTSECRLEVGSLK